MSEFTTAVVLNDVHIPFEDKRVVKLVLSFIKWFKPGMVFLNGDILDFYEVSKYDKDPKRGANLQQEILKGTAFLQSVRDAAPSARIIYTEGNHEHRLHRYLIANAPALTWVDGLKMPGLLGLDRLNIEYVPCDADKFIDTYFQWGQLLIGHFNTCRSQSGATARALLEQFGISSIQGHCHSTGSANKTLHPNKQIASFENGCLCNLHPHYTNPKNWMHSICVVHKENKGSYFQVQQIPIINGQFHFGGKHWRG